ncbi:MULTISPECIES: hypothetical protein [Campylobacter]|uniref:Lipoprotein n=1 Tax=Campylobacter vicugnae TaxID=1660076 RepID=A0ABZ2E872_9BACT|nr:MULTISPECIES: hypothetical protein [Campylobacter]ARR03317.1 hypothetical protein CVIC12175_0153 [Campylobacter sp. RM12175]MCR8690427.1 hypothetical protein [Campylobacter sp. RM9264]MCR8701701.1 hypothetical protein [Campylobacter sp. RM12176]MDL0095322.1 hypothetical protein [Campylobacter ovis]
MRKNIVLSCAILAAVGIGLSGCSSTAFSIANKPTDFVQDFKTPACDTKNYLADELQKAKDGDDPIYLSINAASVARSCGKFELSNEFLDLAEDSYKFDVDLESTTSKVTKNAIGVLLNDTFTDYDGNLYERIMVNVYKGLNFMSLGDYENARVEFNRALLRQDKAKDYFAAQIAANKKELEKAKKDDPNYKENAKNSKVIQEQYSQLFAEFKTSEKFTNPYATYLASVFFFLDGDYANSADKFREIAIANPKNRTFANINRTLQNKAKRTRDDGKRYIFLAYEDGLGTIKENFRINMPYVMSSNNIATLNLALPTLKKRDASYKNISINNNKAAQVSNFDDIFATEFKIELPGIITKSILSMAAKSATSAAVANDGNGMLSLLTSATMSAINVADTRVWQTLPKTANIAMVPNNGSYTIKDSTGATIASGKVDKKKNALIWVRSIDKKTQPQVIVQER